MELLESQSLSETLFEMLDFKSIDWSRVFWHHFQFVRCFLSYEEMNSILKSLVYKSDNFYGPNESFSFSLESLESPIENNECDFFILDKKCIFSKDSDSTKDSG